MTAPPATLHAACRCGAVRMTLSTPPFLSAVCYCDDCQQAARRLEALEALEGAPVLREADGGTPCVMVRKDRVAIETGEEHLAALHLSPGSPTRRVLATCCNTPMFLDVTIAHWLTLYRDRLPAPQRPPIEMRVMTKYRETDLPWPDTARRYEGHTGRFFMRVLGAWAKMGFRRPKLPDYPHISV